MSLKVENNESFNCHCRPISRVYVVSNSLRIRSIFCDIILSNFNFLETWHCEIFTICLWDCEHFSDQFKISKSLVYNWSKLYELFSEALLYFDARVKMYVNRRLFNLIIVWMSAVGCFKTKGSEQLNCKWLCNKPSFQL